MLDLVEQHDSVEPISEHLSDKMRNQMGLSPDKVLGVHRETLYYWIKKGRPQSFDNSLSSNRTGDFKTNEVNMACFI